MQVRWVKIGEFRQIAVFRTRSSATADTCYKPQAESATVKRWLKVMDGTMPACLTVKTNEERRAYCDLLCDIVLFKKKFWLVVSGGIQAFSQQQLILVSIFSFYRKWILPQMGLPDQHILLQIGPLDEQWSIEDFNIALLTVNNTRCFI